MKAVIDQYVALRNLSSSFGDELSKTFNIPKDQLPAGFYGMSFNSITLALELLDCYFRIWQKIDASDKKVKDVEGSRKENTQRVISIQRLTFIEIMSSFEYAAKQIVSIKQATFGEFRGRIYLSRIMEKSLELGQLNQDQLKQWNGVIRLRNSLVHNNGISEETAIYQYPNVEINVIEGMKTQGNLTYFGYIIEWILYSSKEWVLEANKSLKQGTRENKRAP